MTSPAASTLLLPLGNRELAVRVRRNARAKRLTLRIDAVRDGIDLVLPACARLEDGLRFLHSRTGWIAARLAVLPPRVPFADGAVVPLRGVPRQIRHRPGLRLGPVRLEADGIHVGGAPEHLPRRLGDWLRREAMRDLAALAREKAAAVGRPVTRITVRDTRSRWGSCATGGRLAFSWRLILAPQPVLDYVVAHEVAHLVEMNHGPRFWALAASLTGDMERCRGWLKRNGTALLRYG